MNEIEQLTDEELAVLEWQYHYCGDFFKALWEAITRADAWRLDRLEVGFPKQVGGFRRYTYQEGWWPEVQAKAKQVGWLKS